MTPPSMTLLERILHLGPSEFWPMLGYFITVVWLLVRRVFYRRPSSLFDCQLLLCAGMLMLICIAARLSIIYSIGVTSGVGNDTAVHYRTGDFQAMLLSMAASVILILGSLAIPSKK